jgi:hypothetical protein
MRTNRTARLSAIDQALPKGCPTCTSWSDLHTDHHAPDEPFTPSQRPASCPRCGRSVPIRLIREYVILDPDDPTCSGELDLDLIIAGLPFEPDEVL